MISLIDYGVGNLFSLKSSLKKIGADIIVTKDAEVIKKSDKILLPGVGAFEDASEKLFNSGLGEIIKEEALNNKPLLGICLGMQLLFDESLENGKFKGLGLISGIVKPISDVIPDTLKIPHIGWNALDIKKASPIFKYIKNGDHVYFVHSYYATDCDENTSATTEYGALLTASVEKGNVFGCQFHPEKSGEVGLNILKAFCEL